MTWRGSAEIKDRIFSLLVYLFPLAEGLAFGAFLLQQFPVLNFLNILVFPVFLVYALLAPFVGSWSGFLIFIILFVGVARNTRLPHFLRFNAMQSILLGILLSLLGLFFQIFGPILGQGIIGEVLYNTIFLATVAACLYSIIQSVRGLYAELPMISEVAYLQVR